MDFFYRRFHPLDVFLYAFGVKNDDSHRNLPSPGEAASNFAFETASSLPCPVGEFTVCSGDEKIPFNVRKNNYDVPYAVYDGHHKEIIREITAKTNYAVDIDTKSLFVGKKYEISFSDGGLHFGGSDEHTESVVTTIGNYSFGIGSYNMNDNYFHMDDPHRGYDVWRSEDGRGFSFVLLDRTVEVITFRVAWIEREYIKNVDYEEVLDFWLT